MLSILYDSLAKLARGTRIFLALGLGHLENVILHGRPHVSHQPRAMAYPKCGAVAIAASCRIETRSLEKAQGNGCQERLKLTSAIMRDRKPAILVHGCAHEQTCNLQLRPML